MSTTNAGLDDIDITNEELTRITKAFKNEEFKKLFTEYCDEINDPENRRIYESELTQLESERGIDLTFLHPLPGYVLKTTTNGELKTFINVAKCDKISKPSSKCGVNSNGEKGLNWSLPYAQSTARRDYDKNGKLCAVYDVVFHPDTIHLAHKNVAFKNLVSSTALDAVASANNITLDMVNVKSPNITFKGTARPTVIRKKKTMSSVDNLEPSPIDHIYPPLLEETRAATKTTKDKRNETTKNSSGKNYTTPKYTLSQRRHVEYAEMTEELDAKLNSTIPSELVLKLDLPLLRNINDTTLDVTSDELYLISEVPARYKLRVKLPYAVDETRGSAKFDNAKRTLLVTLPVKRKNLTLADITNRNEDRKEPLSLREDAVIQPQLIQEVDPALTQTSNEYSVMEPVSTPVAKKPEFLDASINYDFPTFTCDVSSNSVTFTLEVKNIDPTTVSIVQNSSYAHLKFMTVGTGFFPQYFAFFIQFPNEMGTIISAQPDVWDNNLILLIQASNLNLNYYMAGVDADHLVQFEAPIMPILRPKKDAVDLIPLETLTIQTKEDGEKPIAKANAKKANDKRRSYSESYCEDYKDNINTNVEKYQSVSKSPIKLRTYSECSSIDENGEPQKYLKGILKRRSSSVWSISESSLDEGAISKSVEFTDNSIPEEHMEHCKKSVRFDNNIRKFLFRTNSTIVGQRKPKTNKRKKKKRTTDRRYSEGEASDYDPKHSSSEGEGNHHPINAGSKGMRTDAMHDSGVDLTDQVHGPESNGKHDGTLKFKSDMIFDIDM